MRFSRYRMRLIGLKEKKIEEVLLKANTSLLTPLVSVLLAGLLSWVGISWQLNEQSRQIEKGRLLDGAQKAAQETSHLLSDGFNALTEFSLQSDGKTWEEIRNGPSLKFMEFHRKWRQLLIADHFQLIRYFGKDLADELILVDEIDLHPTLPDLSSSNPCASSGGNNDLDIDKLAQVTACYLRMAALSQSAAESDKSPGSTTRFLENLTEYHAVRKDTQELISNYDKSSVHLLRMMETRLIQLQGGPYVVLKPSVQ